MKKILLGSCLIVMIKLNAQTVYFGNLHSHTSYSDGSSTPDRAFKYARDNAKIDFLAITEHNHADAGSGRIATDPTLYNGSTSASLISTANRFNQDNRFIAIYGQEFSSITSGNHANIFEIKEVIDSDDVPNGAWNMLLDSWLPDHPDAFGKKPIILLNHPCQSSSPNAKEYGRDDYSSLNAWIKALGNYACLINMVNGPSHKEDEPPGKPCEREFLLYLNMGLRLAPTADQDNHLENWGDAADTRTAVIATSLTKPDILDAIRARNVYATEDKNLTIIGKFNGQLIGSIFGASQIPSINSAITIDLDIKDEDEPNAHYTVHIYADEVGGGQEADVIYEISFIGDTVITIQDVKYTGGNQYFFVKITQTDEDEEIFDHAWLAPVWFDPNAEEPSNISTELLTLSVNLATEEAEISNIGTTNVNLKNWTLVSMVGNQVYKFTTNRIIKPGESVIVTSGPNAKNSGMRILWTTQYIWVNSGDPGELRNSHGFLIASTSH